MKNCIIEIIILHLSILFSSSKALVLLCSFDNTGLSYFVNILTYNTITKNNAKFYLHLYHKVVYLSINKNIKVEYKCVDDLIKIVKIKEK